MIEWVLPPLSNSWIMNIIWLYIALNRTPSIDCYWGGSTQMIEKISDLRAIPCLVELAEELADAAALFW